MLPTRISEIILSQKKFQQNKRSTIMQKKRRDAVLCLGASHLVDDDPLDLVCNYSYLEDDFIFLILQNNDRSIIRTPASLDKGGVTHCHITVYSCH